MPKYASDTAVPVDRTRAEIERTLVRYGAVSFLYGWEEGRAVIAFRMGDRSIRMLLPLPSEEEFKYTPKQRWLRDKQQQRNAYDQAIRQRWRALALVIKAKLEAVDAGISTIEREFLADTLLPSGQTVGEWVMPQMEHAALTGEMPKLLPVGSG